MSHRARSHGFHLDATLPQLITTIQADVRRAADPVPRTALGAAGRHRWQTWLAVPVGCNTRYLDEKDENWDGCEGKGISAEEKVPVFLGNIEFLDPAHWRP